MLRALAVLGALLAQTVQATAAVYSYTYVAGDVVCEVSEDDCQALAFITAPGRNSFSINTSRYPLALSGSHLSINVNEFMAVGDLFSVVISDGGNSFTSSGGYADVVGRIGIVDPRGILAELLTPPVAYANSAFIAFGDDGRILRWSFGIVTGGSGDYGSSGVNGFGREDVANGAFTQSTGRWSVTVAAIPVPPPGFLLTGVLFGLAVWRRRSAVTQSI